MSDDGSQPYNGPERRKPIDGPLPGWLALEDDDLLLRVLTLPADHKEDAHLMEIVRSRRHFFIRQEAAKKMCDKALLREKWDDRHIGQILVRALTRAEDVAYLEKLRDQTQHLDVRKAAEAQLQLIASTRERR